MKVQEFVKNFVMSFLICSVSIVQFDLYYEHPVCSAIIGVVEIGLFIVWDLLSLCPNLKALFIQLVALGANTRVVGQCFAIFTGFLMMNMIQKEISSGMTFYSLLNQFGFYTFALSIKGQIAKEQYMIYRK